MTPEMEDDTEAPRLDQDWDKVLLSELLGLEPRP